MAREDIREKYSCKRKKDCMTFSAVVFFFLVVLAELYLVFYVPIQLQREGVLQKHVAKVNVVKMLDRLRGQINHSRANKGKADDGELALALQILNDYAQYTRLNLEYLSHSELLELIDQLRPYDKWVNMWLKKQYIFNDEMIPLQGFYKNIEKKYGM